MTQPVQPTSKYNIISNRCILNCSPGFRWVETPTGAEPWLVSSPTTYGNNLKCNLSTICASKKSILLLEPWLVSSPITYGNNLKCNFSTICASKKSILMPPVFQQQLKYYLPIVLFVTFCFAGSICFGQGFQLATPLMKYESVFFDSAATVEMKFNQTGATIYYTLNGHEPTASSLKYTKPVAVTKSFTTIKAIAAAKGFTSSAVIAATFIKNGAAISAIDFPAANKKYAGSGPNTLTDNKGGLSGTGAGTWLGYQEDSVEITVLLQKKQAIQQVLADCLQDHGSWIFLPQQIQVYYFDEDQASFLPLVEKSFTDTALVEGAYCKPLLLQVDKAIETDQLKIVLTGTASIPAWHPGKGQKGWLFIDEIKVY